MVAYGGPSHIGGYLRDAAEQENISFSFCDIKEAFGRPSLFSRFKWHFCGHLPDKLGRFSKKVINLSGEFNPTLFIATGISPVNLSALEFMREKGIKLFNYLTDDPFSRVHYSPWFIKSVPLYHCIFSPRKANIRELAEAGCKKVIYMPFAYSPTAHYNELPRDEDEKKRFEADIVFIGGADNDRMPYITAFIKAGFKISLYGLYWDRYPQTRHYAHGSADPEILRKSISTAKISLCLARRLNRDGHSMRTFEIPAIGGCMLTEDTQEHREMFGEEGRAVLYFKNISEMIDKAKFLIQNQPERERLAIAAHSIVSSGNNTYTDRLNTMLRMG